MSDSFINNKYNRRKIIHVDMDCFYAAVELRDKPHLKFKPVAVSGAARLGAAAVPFVVITPLFP